jgi:hypothetical protein
MLHAGDSLVEIRHHRPTDDDDTEHCGCEIVEGYENTHNRRVGKSAPRRSVLVCT